MPKKRKRPAARDSKKDAFHEQARGLLLHEFGLDQEVWAWFHQKEQPVRSLFAAAAISDGLGTVGLARVDEDDLQLRLSRGESVSSAATTLYIGREEAALVLQAVAQAFPELMRGHTA